VLHRISFAIFTCALTFLGTITFGRTFVCTDWKGGYADEVFKGTMSIGELTGNRLIISNAYKNKIELSYLGPYNSTGVSLYQGLNKYNSVSVYAIANSADYDFQLVEISVSKNSNKYANCNYQN